jgi:insulysin
VQVGSFEDYRDMAGTAHALEHLCFMGSDKFPDENEWSSWLAANGGMSNAYTASSVTNYHYEVNAAALLPSLERFSRFFVAPLLMESAWSRELLNIDSEHDKNLNNDMWREMQLDRSTGAEGHARNRFATGSKATLHDEPVAAGIDVRSRLMEFHTKHYIASHMTVAVIGRESCKEIMGWAHRLFEDVRDSDLPPLRYGADPFEGRTEIVQYMLPLRDSRSVSLTWRIEPQLDLYKSKPSRLASHLLGHEGPGSVLSALKKQGWATDLSAGEFEVEFDYAVFGVQVELTPLGLEHVDDVVACIFAGIRVLRSTPVEEQRWAFEETAAVAASGFRFAGKGGAMQTTTALANRLCKFPPEHVVSGEALLREWDPSGYSRLLSALTPHNARVRITAKEVADACDKVEPVYGTKYGEVPTSAEQLALWGGPGGLETPEEVLSSYAAGIRLPDPNPFIATDFSLKSTASQPGRLREQELRTATDDSLAKAASLWEPADRVVSEAASPVGVCGRHLMPVPKLLKGGSPHSKTLWYQDDWFGEPKVNIFVSYELPLAFASAEAAVMRLLLSRVVSDQLNELAYAANVAGLRYSFTPDTTGLNVAVSGFSEKASTLLERVVAAVTAAVNGEASAIESEVVARQLETTVRELRNSALDQPFRSALSEGDYVVKNPSSHYLDRLAVLEHLQSVDGSDRAREKLLEYASTVFTRGSATILVAGNVDEDDVRAIEGVAVGPLEAKKATAPTALEQLTDHSASIPPVGVSSRIVVPGRNPVDSNGAVEVRLFFGADTPRMSAVSSLLAQLMKEPAFDQLRTKEALGYIVFTAELRQAGSVGLRLIVQSSKCEARALEARIEAFLMHFRSTLASMTAEAFADNVRGAILPLRQEDSSLGNKAREMWTEVQDRTMDFERSRKEVQVLEAITKDEVLQVYDDHVMPSGQYRRRFAILYEAGTASAEVAAAEDAALPPAPPMTTLTGPRAVEHLLEAASRPTSSALGGALASLTPTPVAELPPALLKSLFVRLPLVKRAGWAVFEDASEGELS